MNKKLLLQVSDSVAIVCRIPLSTKLINGVPVRECVAMIQAALPQKAWKCKQVSYLFVQNYKIKNVDRITGCT